jgi:transcriptional regulator with XRE-family HTH domain
LIVARIDTDMSKLDRQSKEMMNSFSESLKSFRRGSGLSLLDCAYILNISFGTFSYWLSGRHLPRSIIHYKKLSLLFPGVYGAMRDIFNSYDWKVEFSYEVDTDDRRRRNPVYRHNDARDIKYRIGFGDYLLRSRLSMGIPVKDLSHAIGVNKTAYYSWECGVNFPRALMMLGSLDCLYGDTLEVIFDTCHKQSIHLSKKEKREVISRVHECRGEVKSKGWLRHNHKFLESQRKYRSKESRDI